MAALESQSAKRKAMTFIAHALLIVIIFILPEMVMAIALPHRKAFSFNTAFYVQTAIFIAIFYINYYLIVDRTISKGMTGRNILKFLLYNFAVIIIGLIVCHIVSYYTFGYIRRNAQGPPPDFWHRTLKSLAFVLRDLVMMILTLALAVALRLSYKWKTLQDQQRELLSEQRATELDSLKSQLNPHFLFNTLNTIYALIAIDSTKAQNAVHRLSGLLRYMLYEDTGLVPLSKECTFIEDYVSLMRLRLSNRQIDVSINTGSHSDTMIPALLFIPLVENAFKYGNTASNDTPIRLAIEAKDSELTCTTHNAFEAVETDKNIIGHSSGIGLANLRRRIAIIYGQEASLSTHSKDNTFTATLRIPL